MDATRDQCRNKYIFDSESTSSGWERRQCYPLGRPFSTCNLILLSWKHATCRDAGE